MDEPDQPGGTPLTDADRAAIRRVIELLLAAAQRGDALTTFGLVSPSVQARASMPERMLRQLVTELPAVQRFRTVRFGPQIPAVGGPVQEVLLTATDGTAELVRFRTGRQADGAWRVQGWLPG
jgi:hypothetical protein